MSFSRIHSTFKSLTDTVDLSADDYTGADAYADAGDNADVGAGAAGAAAADNADVGALAIERQSAQVSADSDELEWVSGEA